MSARFDLVVVGLGHAGTEAALAAARMGCRVVGVTLSPGKAGLMSCNPAIGGPGKSQLVAEIDALGGVMAEAGDEAGLQFRVLNRSKGPAIRATRAQVDRVRYAVAIRRRLEAQPGLELIEGAVIGLRLEAGALAGTSALRWQRAGLLRRGAHDGDVPDGPDARRGQVGGGRPGRGPLRGRPLRRSATLRPHPGQVQDRHPAAAGWPDHRLERLRRAAERARRGTPLDPHRPGGTPRAGAAQLLRDAHQPGNSRPGRRQPPPLAPFYGRDRRTRPPLLPVAGAQGLGLSRPRGARGLPGT